MRLQQIVNLHLSTFGRLAAALVLACVSFSLVGCSAPDDPMLDLIDTDLRKTKVDDLSRTMGFVFSDRRFDQKEFGSKVATGLNRWVSYSEDQVGSDDWKLDPAVDSLFEEYKGLALLEMSEDVSFLNTDAYFLQQVAWVTQVAKRVTDDPRLNIFELYRLSADYKPTDETADPVDELIKKLNPSLNDEDAEKISFTFKFFDWITRNIQLTPEVVPTKEDQEEQRLNDKEGFAESGVIGMGYRNYPWQTLLFSRGDYVDQSKLLLAALQYFGIDAAMLSVKTDDGLKPWAVGVVVGDDYYLFDAKLGMPLPGKKIGSIATLSAVRADGELLSGLDLTNEESLADETDYWVKPEQLDDLVAYLYFEPESVAKRMDGLESRLIGDDRLSLTIKPTEALARLPKIEGVSNELWDTSFKTHVFRQAVREALEDTDNDVIADRLQNWYYKDEAYIDGFTRYRTSRARFFEGRFESPRNAVRYNAIESFEKLMYTDKTVDSLATDKQLQSALGILKQAGQDAADFNFQVRSVQGQMRLVRRDTGLFLAQCHFDNGSVGAAANWLNVLEDKEDSERWASAINYMLGRSHESRKEYDLAIENYKELESSTRFHGNLIRVRMLGELIKRLKGEPLP